MSHIKYPRPKLNRIIDFAIGYGDVMVEFRHKGYARLQLVTIEAQGHMPQEQEIARRAAAILRKQAKVSPEAVRIVQAAGTWQEIPSWTGEWFPTPD